MPDWKQIIQTSFASSRQLRTVVEIRPFRSLTRLCVKWRLFTLTTVVG